MEEFRSFFKDRDLNRSVITVEKLTGEVCLPKATVVVSTESRHGKYRDMDERRRYKKEWMAKKRLKSKQGVVKSEGQRTGQCSQG